MNTESIFIQVSPMKTVFVIFLHDAPQKEQMLSVRKFIASQFQHEHAAHRKAEGLKIRTRIFRPSALNKL
jgi:hypothetical protein